jgi:hypothetical protein
VNQFWLAIKGFTNYRTTHHYYIHKTIHHISPLKLQRDIKREKEQKSISSKAFRKLKAVSDSCGTQAETFHRRSPDQTGICRSCLRTSKEHNPTPVRSNMPYTEQIIENYVCQVLNCNFVIKVCQWNNVCLPPIHAKNNNGVLLMAKGGYVLSSFNQPELSHRPLRAEIPR